MVIAENNSPKIFKEQKIKIQNKNNLIAKDQKVNSSLTKTNQSEIETQLDRFYSEGASNVGGLSFNMNPRSQPK